MAKIMYSIEIIGWEKYNKKSTKNMPSIMISKRFFDDSKMQMLSSSCKLLYIYLLLRRGDVDTTMFTCTHDDCKRSAGGRGVVVSTLLDQLQSFQLLKYEKVASNIIEYNRIEENRIEVARNRPVKKKSTESTEQNKQIWEAYLNAYLKRYGVPPLRNAMVNKQVSNLRERVGYENAIKLVEFFLSHNESFYLKKTHAIGLCLQDCESLMTQMKRNQPITQAKVKMFEKQQTKIENDLLIENLWSDENANSK